MISVNESIIQVWHKYQNIVKSFFFSGGAYKRKKNDSKIDKSFPTLLTHPSSVVLFQISFDHFITEIWIHITRHGSWKGSIQNAIRHKNEIWSSVSLSSIKHQKLLEIEQMLKNKCVQYMSQYFCILNASICICRK